MTSGTGRRRIWVVDDSSLDLERARRALAPRHDVRVFDDGAAALEELASGQDAPDLLAVDWIMPGVSGLDVCRFVRADPRHAGLAILLLTVHQRPEQVVEGLDAGADDFLTKPYAEVELRARVEALLRPVELRRRLQAAEQRVRLLLAHAPDAMLALDDDGRIVFANDEAARCLGSGLEGRPFEEVVALRSSLLRTEVPRGLRPEVRREGRVLEVSARILEEQPGVRRIVLLRDVTAQREEQQRQLDLYSTIAHDLRSPLSASLLRLETLLRGKHGPLAPGLRDDLQRIQRSQGELVAMINDFLEVTRNQSARDLRRSPVDAGTLAAETVEEFAPVAETSSIALRLDRGTGDLACVGDRVRLKRALANLVSNALKFTSPGGLVCVSVDRDPGGDDDEGGDLVLRVRDTGRGIAADALPTLFDRYTRSLDDAHVVAGSGLGLMIVRQIAEAHGGSVGVESERGVGSTFWIRLPPADALVTA